MNNNTVEVPCHGCEERAIRCHASCERYIEFEKQNLTRRKKEAADTKRRSEAYSRWRRLWMMKQRDAIPENSFRRISSFWRAPHPPKSLHTI